MSLGLSANSRRSRAASKGTNGEDDSDQALRLRGNDRLRMAKNRADGYTRNVEYVTKSFEEVKMTDRTMKELIPQYPRNFVQRLASLRQHADGTLTSVGASSTVPFSVTRHEDSGLIVPMACIVVESHFPVPHGSLSMLIPPPLAASLVEIPATSDRKVKASLSALSDMLLCGSVSMYTRPDIWPSRFRFANPAEEPVNAFLKGCMLQSNKLPKEVIAHYAMVDSTKTIGELSRSLGICLRVALDIYAGEEIVVSSVPGWKGYHIHDTKETAAQVDRNRAMWIEAVNEHIGLPCNTRAEHWPAEVLTKALGGIPYIPTVDLALLRISKATEEGRSLRLRPSASDQSKVGVYARDLIFPGMVLSGLSGLLVSPVSRSSGPKKESKKNRGASHVLCAYGGGALQGHRVLYDQRSAESAIHYMADGVLTMRQPNCELFITCDERIRPFLAQSGNLQLTRREMIGFPFFICVRATSYLQPGQELILDRSKLVVSGTRVSPFSSLIRDKMELKSVRPSVSLSHADFRIQEPPVEQQPPLSPTTVPQPQPSEQPATLESPQCNEKEEPSHALGIGSLENPFILPELDPLEGADIWGGATMELPTLPLPFEYDHILNKDIRLEPITDDHVSMSADLIGF